MELSWEDQKIEIDEEPDNRMFFGFFPSQHTLSIGYPTEVFRKVFHSNYIHGTTSDNVFCGLMYSEEDAFFLYRVPIIAWQSI